MMSFTNFDHRGLFGTLYCDMDGVLADFWASADPLLGLNGVHDRNVKLSPEQKQRFAHTPNFWFDLPVMKDAHMLWDYIAKYDPCILTASLGADPTCVGQKANYMMKNFGVPKERFIAVNHASDKYKFARTETSPTKPNILIDDFERNIGQWKNAGGLGIHHVNAEATIWTLKQYGF